MLDRPSSPRFEVSALRDKRWVIDCLTRTEEEARARAEEIFADESYDGVRVARGRFGNDGTVYESIILEQARQARRGERPVRIAATPDELAWCETLDDLYGPPSRQAIARILRNFLDRYNITPTELLHHHRYVKQLERQDELMGQAVQRIAAHQARSRGVDARSRLDLLDRLVNEAGTRARDAVASRAAPRLGEGGLAALAEAVAERVHSPSDQGFYLRFAVSLAFEDLGGFGQKLEKVAAWAAEDRAAPLLPLLDELAAGLLGAATLIQEVLGGQPHLGGALTTLIELAAGRTDPTAKLTPLATGLAKLLAQTGMAETRLVLLERVQRELASDKPLSRDDAAGQRRLFEGLLEKLVDERGLFHGGMAMVEAIARRSRRYGIVGGIEDPRFASDDPAARIEQLVAIAEGVLAERQQRAIATCLVEQLDRFGGDPAALAALRPRAAALTLPDPCKAAVLERLTAGKN